MYKYIIGIIQNQGHKVLAINGMADHIHIFMDLRPNQSLSELIKFVKRDSSKWVNQQGFIKSRFSWQEGFGAFSYSKSHVDAVIEYIKNQENHHRKKTFREEYLEFLEKFDVNYDERFVFKSIGIK